MPEKIVIPSEGMEKEPPKKALLPVSPVRTPDQLRGELLQSFGEYPFYALLLYNEMQTDLAEFVRVRGGLLHILSGDDCLIRVLENPTNWDATWEDYWKEKLGNKYPHMSEKWHQLKPFHQNISYEIARQFSIPYDSLPCIFLFESVKNKQGLVIPIVIDKENYLKFFEELFRILHNSLEEKSESRLSEFRKSYRGFWIKWVVSKKVKNVLESFNEWGSLIVKTEKTILDIIAPVKSFLNPVT